MSLSDAGTVLLIGAGKMGMAMAAGWVQGGLPGSALTLVDPQPHESVSAFARRHGAVLRTDLPDESPRVVVLAVKPQIMGAVLGMVKPLVGAGTLVVSIAAGVSSDKIAKGLATDRVVRSMPNTPAQIGKGISGAFAGEAVTAEDRTLTEALLAAAGGVVWVEDETLIDAVTAVSGSGPAYVFHLVEAMAAAGEAEGLSPQQAMVLARQTVIGAAALMEADDSSAEQLRKNVTSPNGTTQAALDVLMAPDGLGALMQRAVRAARKRSEELGQ
ncbi:pyrroline-5-carboxylate reductase [Pelagibacterium halotolerans]|uniref:Pyrroline-5-carboxylate reductase n=1 Tax=Pelagibacterium halotolerans (strain DSM 22347 / JCM 15775 / CGMCC 1.7692 / B2) TaxID=1082931 RepID=G4R686_PELHB|nr:pyrroline-5-carboxylate reductase [Pelagibacterium halotolerans]AEQ52179.1 pyrroline-5-carboxylate reductase [Pelagibacterium halotolerans B2]QJR18061.1 pyrroline-5-carboxylate reductase [Pelagibacterium halotolerans]SDZ85146.1 pyrroline-5-carboxylate reductase [Pelagibacterium halotolerans]